MFAIENQRTLLGRYLRWRGDEICADDPVSAWNELLRTRGLSETDTFFSPRLADLPDPDAMRDMAMAADRLASAVRRGEAVHVFGDFDADGVCGTAILVEALQSTGLTVTFSIPHRAEQGHGIGVEAVRDAAATGCRLGISVDTGTTCFEACAEAKRLGLDLIVTDHHLPESTLPDAFAMLNPARLDCGFADRRLCGTGVAFFLLMAVWKRLRQGDGKSPDFDLRSLLDRVAVATVADVMDLVGVNRILVSHGLARLNAEPSIGIEALLSHVRGRKRITVETIGFHLAPRINAAGRMQHGEAAMRLLSARDRGEAALLAQELDAANKERRQAEAEVFRQVEEKLAGSNVLAAYDESWHAGVVGLAAGRLARKHGKPAAVGFITPAGEIRVSLRGRPGFHIGELLNVCSDYLYGFGGHAGAGGGTVSKSAWPDFIRVFAAAVAEQAKHGSDYLTHEIDGVLGLGAMHIGLAERLARFEPFGNGNPACSWLLKNVRISDRRELKGGVLRLKLTDGVQWIDGIVFGSNGLDEALQSGCVVSPIGQLQRDEWRGNGAIQFVIEDALALN